MTFQEIAAQMGIDTYPEELEAIFAQNPTLPVTESMLCRWQEELHLFGDFYNDVLTGYKDLLQKSAELSWTATVCRYLQTATRIQARALALPVADGSPARDMIPLFLLLSRLEWAMAEYVHRGFTPEQTREMMGVFQGDFRSNIRQCGRPGVNKSYYDWTVLVMYCVLLPCRGFKFDIRKNPKTATLLRSKKTGALTVLVHDIPVHRSGYCLGTAGCEEEDGSFIPTITETDDAFLGYPADKTGLVSPEKQTFSKAQWEVLSRPGDDVLGIHIPRGADIRPDAVRYAVDGVLEHIRNYYPEYHIKAVHCASWMLNPELGDLAGNPSKLAMFSDLFCRYPIKSNGKAVFGFVFSRSSNPDLATLPEDTRLQRAIKQRYLQGGYVHAFGGYYL